MLYPDYSKLHWWAVESDVENKWQESYQSHLFYYTDLSMYASLYLYYVIEIINWLSFRPGTGLKSLKKYKQMFSIMWISLFDSTQVAVTLCMNLCKHDAFEIIEWWCNFSRAYLSWKIYDLRNITLNDGHTRTKIIRDYYSIKLDYNRTSSTIWLKGLFSDLRWL